MKRKWVRWKTSARNTILREILMYIQYFPYKKQQRQTSQDCDRVLRQQQERYRNEQGGSSIKPSDTDLIVYRDGWIGTSSLLKVGDRVEYITGSGRHSQICAGDIRHVGYGIHCCKNKRVNYDTSTIKAAIGFTLSTRTLTWTV